MNTLFDYVKTKIAYSEFVEALERSVEDLIYDGDEIASDNEEFRSTWECLRRSFLSPKAILEYAGYEEDEEEEDD